MQPRGKAMDRTIMHARKVRIAGSYHMSWWAAEGFKLVIGTRDIAETT
jgi:hypothetical protein